MLQFWLSADFARGANAPIQDSRRYYRSLLIGSARRRQASSTSPDHGRHALPTPCTKRTMDTVTRIDRRQTAESNHAIGKTFQCANFRADRWQCCAVQKRCLHSEICQKLGDLLHPRRSKKDRKADKTANDKKKEHKQKKKDKKDRLVPQSQIIVSVCVGLEEQCSDRGKSRERDRRPMSPEFQTSRSD